MNAPGKLIVVEGIDGAGKSTLVQRLAEFLEGAGHAGSVLVSCEPTKEGPHGKRLRDAQASGNRLDPQDEFDTFFADRLWHVEHVIAPAIAVGKVVLLDRYYFSTMAYQSLRGFDAEATRALYEHAVPLPDVLLVLDLPVALALERCKLQAKSEGEAFERSDVLAHCREVYLSQAGRPFVEVIHAGSHQNRVLKQAIQRLRAALPNFFG
jgi:dTMP kinase